MRRQAPEISPHTPVEDRLEQQNEHHMLLRYGLAYINPRISGVDNGRILGYDNSHGHHHRHSMGKVSAINFSSYEALLERFQKEVLELWRDEDEKKT